MASFLTFLAAPAVRQVSKRPVFGKPYVTVGSLFCTIGWWVYQSGGVLGYCLRDSPNVLARLAVPPGIAAINEDQIIQEVRGSADIVAAELKEAEDDEKTFFYLYTVRELRGIGIDIQQWPPDKRLNEKADAEFAGDVMRISFVRGIDLGFNFPGQFAVYWENTCRVRPDTEWQKWCERGIVPSKIQQRLTLKAAITEVLEGAVVWNKSQSPSMLASDDIRVLQAVIEANSES